MHERFARLTGILAASSLLWASVSSAQAVRAGVTINFSPRGGMHAAVAKVLGLTKSWVAIAMYSVSPGQVEMWEPLRQAVARGVKCSVLLNDANASNKAKAAAFEGIGCDVRFIGYTMHHKFMVADGQHTCTGSSNWSKGAEEKYSEHRFCFVKYPGVARDFMAEFQRLWERSVDFPVTGRPKYPAAPEGSGTMPAASDRGIYNLFTTQNSKTSALLTQSLIRLIQGAKSSLDIAVANYNSAAIKDAVCAAKRRGVAVRVLTDQGQFSISTSRVRALEACGVDVRYIVYGLTWYHPYAQLMHHKAMIVDRTHLAAGSFNWSDTAEYANAENLQIISKIGSTNGAILNAFQKEFDTLWDLNRAKIPLLMAAFTKPIPGRCQPIHWDTDYLRLRISLTRREFTPVRGLALRQRLFDRKNAAMRCVDVSTGRYYPTVPQGTTYYPGL